MFGLITRGEITDLPEPRVPQYGVLLKRTSAPKTKCGLACFATRLQIYIYIQIDHLMQDNLCKAQDFFLPSMANRISALSFLIKHT